MRRRAFLLLASTLFVGGKLGAEEIRYTASGDRDPFASPVVQKKIFEDSGASEKKLQSLSVQGIVASVKNPRVIINGKIYRIGNEPIPGVRIARIDKDGILVMSGEKETLLRRPSPTIKGKKTDELA